MVHRLEYPPIWAEWAVHITGISQRALDNILIFMDSDAPTILLLKYMDEMLC